MPQPLYGEKLTLSVGTIMKKTTQLKNMLTSNELEFIMEAHNGLSAKIVEEAGFKGIWGSGLSISAALGVRDNNEASWTQVLEVCEFMSDATKIPLLLDGDTGYGNFNNMMRLVKKLEQRGVAGVCIEDKIFPKTNSFLRGEQQPLANIDEFAGKIKAGLDARTDEDFCIVARVEAFIAGWGLKEALKRAEAYRQAGASAILMHSKQTNPDEIFSFMKEWGDRCPVVIVPTKYYSTPTDEFRNHGVSMAIWANHLMRASIQKMQETAKDIYTKESLIDIEDKVVPVKEVFRLQNDKELAEAEKLYLTTEKTPKGIILAASQGKDLGELTKDRPKALLRLNGTPIVKKMVDQFKDREIRDITLVRGFGKEHFSDDLNCNFIDNDDFANTGELQSLYLAKDQLEGEVTISYGDIVFRSYILDMLRESKADITIVVDSDVENRKDTYEGDFVECNEGNTKSYSTENATLLNTNFGKKSDFNGNLMGEWIGVLKTSERGSEIIRNKMDELSKKENFNKLKLPDLFRELTKDDVKINVSYIEGHWLDIDNYEDFAKGQLF